MSSDEDDGREGMTFTVDNDYEGGVWQDGEFYARKELRGRRQSRQEQIYGVFADGSSDEEDRRPHKKGRNRGGRELGGREGKAKLSKPMNFVTAKDSGGAGSASDGKREGKDGKRPWRSRDTEGGSDESDMELDSGTEDNGDSGTGAGASAGSEGPAVGDEGEIDVAEEDDGETKEHFRNLLQAARVPVANAARAQSGVTEAPVAATRSEGGTDGRASGGRGGASTPKSNADFKAFFQRNLAAAAASKGAAAVVDVAAPSASSNGAPGAETPAAAAAGGTGGAATSTTAAAAKRPVKKDSGFAQWEQHTKGFGSRLLERMGFQGRLGKDASGVTRQLEVKVRPVGIGIGFGDFKEAASLRVNREIEADRQNKTVEELEREMGIVPPPKRGGRGVTATAAARAEAAADAGLWRKSAAGRRKKRRYVTADELLSREESGVAGVAGGDDVAAAAARAGSAGGGAPASGGPPRQVVVDMRGPQVKVLASLEDIAYDEESGGGDAAAVAATPKLGQELLHNVSLIAELAEHQLLALQRQRRSSSERAAQLGREVAEMRRRAEGGADRVARLEQVDEILNRVRNKVASDPNAVTADAVLRVFETLQREYPEEYGAFGLAQLAPTMAAPVLRRALADWRPLLDPDRAAAVLAPWRPVLTAAASDAPLYGKGAFGGGGGGGARLPWSTAVPRVGEAAFHYLASELVLPPVRSALVNFWEVTNAAPALTLAASLAEILPRPAWDALLREAVAPRLTRAVAQWQPRADPAPIDAWLLPWMPWLSPSLVPLFQGIRRKLAAVLTDWHAEDASALAALRPWVPYFDVDSMEQLLKKSVVPKLAASLRSELSTDPARPNPAGLEYTLRWRELLPTRLMTALLEGEFLPKWIESLRGWLAGGDADFQQVADWYQYWKGLLPPEVLADRAVERKAAAALQFMDMALRGVPMPPPDTKPAGYERVLERREIEALAARRERAEAALKERRANDRGGGGGAAAVSAVTFRDVAAAAAADAGIEFVPRVGRQFQGKQIYAFGGVSVYMENDVVFHEAVRGSGDWRPLSLDDLVDYATNRDRAAKASGGGSASGGPGTK